MHIGVDIGGTKVDAVITDSAGTVTYRHRLPTGFGPDAVVASALAAVQQVCADAGIVPAGARSVGVGIPGAINDGVVSHALNLGIDTLDLGHALHEAWGVHPAVDNDVNAAVVGAWIRDGNGTQSMAYLNLGTGLAAGIIVNGKLWRGARGAAGEIGHVSVDPVGPVDADGLRGGIETYAAGSGIARQSGDMNASAQEILARADHDAQASQIRENLYFGVASAVRVLLLTVDVEKVVIGGGLARMGGPLLEGTQRVLREWAHHSPFLRSVQLDQRVALLDVDEPVAAIGAAMRGAGHG